MRLLFVNSALPDLLGGGEKWFVEAASALSARGHDVSLVGRPGSRVVEAAAARGVHTIEFAFGGDYDPFAVWRAGRLIAGTRAEVVVTNFNKDVMLFGPGCRTLGVKLVARHGLMAYKPKLNHRVLHRLYVDQLVVNAPVILERYRDLGFPVDGARVILNGVRPVVPRPHALRERFRLAADTPVVVTFGRLAAQKQLDAFVRIAARIHEAIPTTHFVVLGDGPELDRLRGWIDDADLTGSFHLPGFVPDAASLSAGADLYLLTSRNEGTPNALLEAMSAGVCSLSFDVGAVPLVLDDDLESARIPAGDEEGMAARAIALLSDAGARSALAQAQHARVVDRFDFERSIDAYTSVFDDVVRRR